MAQKINMGNYETRDFFVSVDVTVEDKDEISKVVDYAKGILAEEVGDYYRTIKTGMTAPKTEKVGAATVSGMKEIESATTVEDLKKLEEGLVEMEEGQNKDLLFATYNKRLITLS